MGKRALDRRHCRPWRGILGDTHAISDGLKRSGTVIAFDVAMPRSRLADFRRAALAAVAAAYPLMRVCDFGHCGDGGDHFNIVWPSEVERSDRLYHAVVETLQTMIYDLVVNKYGGTFSAEHGVGPHNQRFYQRLTATTESAVADGLKTLFDCKRLLGNVDLG
jgi:FAD/FMN-containing dehydrogenase